MLSQQPIFQGRMQFTVALALSIAYVKLMANSKEIPCTNTELMSSFLFDSAQFVPNKWTCRKCNKSFNFSYQLIIWPKAIMFRRSYFYRSRISVLICKMEKSRLTSIWVSSVHGYDLFFENAPSFKCSNRNTL